MRYSLAHLTVLPSLRPFTLNCVIYISFVSCYTTKRLRCRPSRALRIQLMTIKSVLMDQSNKMLCPLRVTAIPEQQKINYYVVKRGNKYARNRNRIPSVAKLFIYESNIEANFNRILITKLSGFP